MFCRGTAILIGVIVGIMAVIGAIGVSIWCCAHKAKKKARLQHRAMMTTGVAGAQIRHGESVTYMYTYADGYQDRKAQCVLGCVAESLPIKIIIG